MKEIYYTYNNEAIASCTILLTLYEVEKIDIARSCLILPFLLDDRTINYLQVNKDLNATLEEFINNRPRLFISFNKRYLSLLPVSINSIILLNKSSQIKITPDIVIKNELSFKNIDMGDRFNKIKEVLPVFLKMIENYSTTELYKILNIQL